MGWNTPVGKACWLSSECTYSIESVESRWRMIAEMHKRNRSCSIDVHPAARMAGILEKSGETELKEKT